MERQPWGNLTKNINSNCLGSGPHNTVCKINNESCSLNLGKSGDICYWHFCRMADVEKLRCGCSEWKVLCGDSIGRNLAYRYYEFDDEASLDSANNFYCCSTCQNCDNYQYCCGMMKVCQKCAVNHDKNYLEEINSLSDEEINEIMEENNNEWIYKYEFQKAFENRISNNSYYRILLIAKDGPRDNVRDPVYGSIDICSARSAILASRLYPEQREWWEWLAGWYPDCPPMLPRWI